MEKYVLITGASSGIGKSFAYEYAQKKRNLILVARSKEVLAELKDELISKYGIDVKAMDFDLSKENAAGELFDKVNNEKAEVDILINNAGFGLKGEFLTQELGCYRQMMNLNMITLTELSYLFLEGMLKDGKGTIINVGSMVSFFSAPYNTLYSATKTFVLSLTEGLYYEYKNKGIQFVAICPGATNTNFFQTAGKSNATKGKMREPVQVVESTMKALDKGLPFIVDGRKSKMIVTMSKWLPRKTFPVLLSKSDSK